MINDGVTSQVKRRYPCSFGKCYQALLLAMCCLWLWGGQGNKAPLLIGVRLETKDGEWLSLPIGRGKLAGMMTCFSGFKAMLDESGCRRRRALCRAPLQDSRLATVTSWDTPAGMIQEKGEPHEQTPGSSGRMWVF
jgi:hypothetical protein